MIIQKTEMLIEKPKQIITRANIDQLRFEMKENWIVLEKINCWRKEELRRKEKCFKEWWWIINSKIIIMLELNYQNDIQNQEIDDISDFFDMINQRNQESSKYTTISNEHAKSI